MIVPSPQFLLFAAVAALVFNLGGHRAGIGFTWRQVVLLVANVAFLASFSTDPAALAPLLGFLALGYVAQRLTRNGSNARLFLALLLLTIAAFFWLKRYTFIPGALFLHFPYVLVGLSYVFFRVLHVVIDSHQGAIENDIGVLSYANFTLNFTSLISGPIQRYQDYRETEVQPAPLTLTVAGRALERIVVGYFKVAIVSMLLSQWQHQAMDALAGPHSLLERTELGMQVVVTYTFYLYCNFSGYVDVVIGAARFFGIVLPENFDRPFSAENFIAFWGRWHITLSGWLRTYVYNPVMMASMSRVTAPALSPYLAVFAFFITFFLVGLWHGQTSEFLFFGFLQGGGVAANKLYQLEMAKRLGRSGYRKLCANPAYRIAARGVTFTWFTFTLIWFWSNWGQMDVLSSELGGAAIVLMWVATFIGAAALLALWEGLRDVLLRVRWRFDDAVPSPVLYSRYVRTAWATALVVTTLTVIALLDSPAPDIVYKTF